MAIADNKETLGRIEFMPLSFFDEIITANHEELSALIPPYIGSFERLLNDIFPLNGIQLQQQKKKLIQNELLCIAKGLCDSFTPKAIMDIYFDSFLIAGSDKSILNHKRLWISFLELLSINQLQYFVQNLVIYLIYSKITTNLLV